ncbi:MAG TPA: DUF4391 domain-containing protein [Ilumatobacteraceae bacterium]|nr:DUF4391 domain-containing protein [Ilumatobacteraceae bacterium]
MGERREAGLYLWPERANFGRVVPKGKFYEHGKVNAALRDRFVAEVQRITWAYKLAESTVGLAGSSAVPEIQVFEVECKGADVSDVVLAAIDRAVKLPIIFEVIPNGVAPVRRMAAMPKPSDRGAPKAAGFHSTTWCSGEDRRPLPAAIDLPSLYVALLAPLLPVVTLPGEDAATVAERVEAARRLQREVATLERTLRNEPQFNRKVDLRRRLLNTQTTLDELTSPTT